MILDLPNGSRFPVIDTKCLKWIPNAPNFSQPFFKMGNEDDWASVDYLIDAIKGFVDLHGTKLKRTMIETISVGAEAPMKKKDSKITALSKEV